ncbi:SDR family NAD(P)-dependent oxidoreductase [Staphylococcus nepalensis]|jgi:NAD(P)-dependent dehydrogenase (short-subunit alcohol dehydrogenase family)|uniref:Glucose 1-dehydrogenase n=1 Tax=Staphylococcus nepalensis TaxID=214473 RepID=A0ABS3L2M2_9STAP|nr:glucose 1-dehydrogenase [Staphylococcus nepalensis]MBO1206307.1 glucose 1-dehydrogenase [Staphylococcus nepalensis]MBO1212316.1 glucose 1-dehydrogenase [Staphylococcus nepalensis]MBO1217047.1 glucose 1-dehydrogenase [Staphylococcus nepalensis]MBO1227793.1 glucose 1-dehydrogenase [Staphylococcus nepalensis]MBO1235309.1 glucose 1-dehydrogenase [Staphylococcus nepalensis]
MRLQNKVCIITGAGGGMGKIAAQMFANEGGKIAVFERDEKAGTETVKKIKNNGGEATLFKVDISNEENVKTAVVETVKQYGKIDVLYNNAGVMPEADNSVVNTSEEVWDLVMNINVKGIFLMTKYVIPEMEKNNSGSIINIASFVAEMGCSVPQDAYTASKGAVVSLTKSLAIQFRPKGIRTNAISPGPIETPLLMEWLVSDEEAKNVRLGRQPTGRFGKPEDIVNCALYLASDESDWTNGANINVDGGITANYF